MLIIYFFSWTLILYLVHRLAHIIPFLKYYHLDHHKVINLYEVKWSWNNLLLYNDTIKSTVDLWLTEVIPTLIFCYLTAQWWIFIFYYLWASLIQERIEHDKDFDIPCLTSGKWHLVHHKKGNYNFGLFFSIWDKIFMTENRLYK